MILSIVVAIALDGAIGRGNDLLWHLPADLKRFKELTTGHTILMGRKTFDSLPRGPLPNRRNIVVSRSLPAREGVEVYPTIEEALKAGEAGEEGLGFNLCDDVVWGDGLQVVWGAAVVLGAAKS